MNTQPMFIGSIDIANCIRRGSDVLVYGYKMVAYPATQIMNYIVTGGTLRTYVSTI